MKIQLASKSPRRKMLLEGVGYDVELVEAEVEEIFPDTMSTDNVPEYLAHLKMKNAPASSELVVAADTVVIFKGNILGKPNSKEDAKRMLKMLSGNTHKVVTGVAMRKGTEIKTFSDTTYVEFLELNDHDIERYVEKYSPLDKAGAYGIQEMIGYIAIASMHGSFYNVMGLPIHLVHKAILEWENQN